MKSTARARANRRNAKLSTGPRSQAGKAKTARNALRHALAVPIAAFPVLDATADDLAHFLAGPGASEERLGSARQVGEAQVDLIRVRRARAELLAAALAASANIEKGESGTDIPMARWPPPGEPQAGSLPDFLLGEGKLDPDTAVKSVETMMGDLSKDLKRLDRYERRAHSRIRFAMRALDATNAGRNVDGARP